MSPIPAPLSEAIQRHIDHLQADGDPAWLLRVCKEKLNALPLQANEIFQWALRADGEVLCLDFDSVSLPFEEERNPAIRYAVLYEAARRYPDLREVVPARPEGVQRCEDCHGRGWVESTSSCWGCHGAGWHIQRRPVAEWMERIDRGDQLHLRVHDGGERLVAGRLAGLYVACGDGMERWIAPADAQGRHQLANHLMSFGFGYVYSFGYQKHVIATWVPNPTQADDPFESADHALRFSGTGSGGSFQVEYARQPEGGYRRTTTLNHDWDPLGGGDPVVTTTDLAPAAARAEVEREMRGAEGRNPFPAIVPHAR